MRVNRRRSGASTLPRALGCTAWPGWPWLAQQLLRREALCGSRTADRRRRAKILAGPASRRGVPPHRQHCDRAAIRTGQDDTAVRQRQHLVLVAVDETDLVGRRIHPAAALVEFPDVCTDRPSVRCPLYRAAECVGDHLVPEADAEHLATLGVQLSHEVGEYVRIGAADGLELRHRVVAAKQAQAPRPMPVRRAESCSRVRPHSRLSGTTRPGRRPSRVRAVRAARVRAGSA